MVTWKELKYGIVEENKKEENKKEEVKKSKKRREKIK